MFRTVLKAAGMFLLAVGTIWALQGLGILNWPPQSFMLAQRQWALYGGVTAALGAALLLVAFGKQRS
jgi:hypothetical protein